MIEISEFYEKKSNTERKLEALQELVSCEKLLKADHLHLTGGTCISASKLNTMMSSVDIAPELSNKLYEAIMEAVKDHIVGLKQLNKQITNESKD